MSIYKYNILQARQAAERLVTSEWIECVGAFVWSDAVLYAHPLLPKSNSSDEGLPSGIDRDVKSRKLTKLANMLASALIANQDTSEIFASINQCGWTECFRVAKSRDALIEVFIDMYGRGVNVYDTHKRNGWLLFQTWSDMSHHMPGWEAIH